ncbi:MAG: hypothetical protein Aurels2KO_56100 [Aureliella sp.]
MIKSESMCDDNELRRILWQDSDSCDCADLLDHVEGCVRCQHRLDELAADGSALQKTVEVLSSAGHGTETDDLEIRMPYNPFQLPKWTDSMAKQLLSVASHPEMLGRIGRYDVERLIGSGGMGVVFKGHDTELNRPVAVKLLAPYLASSGAARNRFAREARAAAAVVDDHVVPIHNVETDDEHPFLVMKYIAGGSLQQRLDRDGPLDVCEVLRIGMQTAKGLAAAHAQGLIHRDIKPSNILLDEGVDRALLTDFGLARATDDASLTRSGFQPGTPHYMSPEQVRGEAIDNRSDLFGLGCVLYALCTGHPPFRSETSYAVLRRITDDTPRPIRETNPDVPEWLERIIMKLLAKSAAKRFHSAEQIGEMLEGCLAHVQDPTTAPLPALVTELEKSVRDRRNTHDAENLSGSRFPSIAKLISAALEFFSQSSRRTQESPPLQVHPVRKRIRVLPLTAVATLFIAALVAGVVFYFQTGNGTIRVALMDESLEATINGETIQVEDGEKEYEISAGRQQMVIRQKGSDIEFITDKFQIWRDDQIKFEVRLIAGEVVVSKDGKRFDSKHAEWLSPAIDADQTRQAAKPSLEAFFNTGEAYVHSLGGVTIVPDTSELAVELWVFGNDAPFVQRGDHVRVQFEGWPAVESVGSFAGEVTTIDPAADAAGNFRVLVKPKRKDSWPDEHFLRPGLPVVGVILIGYDQGAKIGGMDNVPSPPAPESPLEASQEKLADTPVSILSPIEGRLVSWGEGIEDNAYVKEGKLIAELKISNPEHLNQLVEQAAELDQQFEDAQSTIKTSKRALEKMPSVLARLEVERRMKAIAADEYDRASEARIDTARAELDAASKESRLLKLSLLRTVTKLDLWRKRFDEGKATQLDLESIEKTVREAEAKNKEADTNSQAAEANLNALLAVQKSRREMNQVKIDEALAKLNTMRATEERIKQKLARANEVLIEVQKAKAVLRIQISDFPIWKVFATASGRVTGLVAADTLLHPGDKICDLRPDQTQSNAKELDLHPELEGEVSFEAGSYSTPEELMARFVAAQRSNDAVGVMSCLSDHAIDQAAAIVLVEVAELMERLDKPGAPVGEANKWKERLRSLGVNDAVVLKVDNALANAELAITQAVGNGNLRSPVQPEVLQIATQLLSNPRRFVFECRELFNLLPENMSSTKFEILRVSDGAWAINEPDQSRMRLKKFDRGWLIDEPLPDSSDQQPLKADAVSQRRVEAIIIVIRDAECVIYYDWMPQPMHDAVESTPYFKVIKDLDDLDVSPWLRDKIREGHFQRIVKIGITDPNRIDNDVISAIGKLKTVEKVYLEFDPSDENSLTESQVVQLIDRIEQECGFEVLLSELTSKLPMDATTTRSDQPGSDVAAAAEDGAGSSMVGSFGTLLGDLPAEFAQTHRADRQTPVNQLKFALRENGVDISDDEIDAEVERLANEFRLTVPAYLARLKKERGLSADEYLEEIVLPTLGLQELARLNNPVSISPYVADLIRDAKKRSNPLGDLRAEVAQPHRADRQTPVDQLKFALRENGVDISDDEIDAEVERLANEFRLTVPAFLARLKKERGLSADEYREEIVLPTLGLQKLARLNDPVSISPYVADLIRNANDRSDPAASMEDAEEEFSESEQ